MTHNLWTNLNNKMYEYLGSVSLGDLVKEQRSEAGAPVPMQDHRPARRVTTRRSEAQAAA